MKIFIFWTILRKHPDIKYNVQQDAQEFLLWLLHQFHEDLRETGRRGRNAARNSFRRIKSLRKNYAFSPLPQSHIERLFGGNYCSTLICPSCKRSKHSTDPFLCLSLPIPIETKKRPMYPGLNFWNFGKKCKNKNRISIDFLFWEKLDFWGRFFVIKTSIFGQVFVFFGEYFKFYLNFEVIILTEDFDF